MAKPDMRRVMAQQQAREQRILRTCPNLPTASGIYIFRRQDEEGVHCYIGQARNLLRRCADHLGEYDHIGLSLKKRGLVGDKTPGEWEIDYIPCPPEELDDQERDCIAERLSQGWHVYNKTAGGQGKGKEYIQPPSPTRGYRDGLTQGESKARRYIQGMFTRYLCFDCKPREGGKPPTKTQLRKLQEFMDWLEEGK